MLELIEEIDYRGLYELRQRRDSGRKILSGVSEELNRTLSGVKAKTEVLKSLNKEYAVTERELKGCQNEIFHINKKCSGIYDGSSLLYKEFVKREEQLTQLKSEEGNLSDRIAGIEKEIHEVSSQLTTLEKERQGLSKSFEEQNAVRQEISDEISEALSKTSLKREEIEPRLMELNKTFLDHIGRRTDIQTRVSEREDDIKELGKTVADLEHQIELLEELKAFKNDRDSIKEVISKLQVVVESVSSKLEDLVEELERKQEQFDVLAKTNEDLNKEIESLEKEVAEYDEAVTRRNRAQEENDSTLERKEQGMEELMGLFTDKTKLETSLLMMEEKIKAMAGLVESVD